MKTNILIAVLFTSCLTSCASYYGTITQTQVNQIRPGVTTEQNLVQLFGQPDTKVNRTHREVLLDWFRSEGPDAAGYLPTVGSFLGGLDLDVQQLSILVGSSGTVSSFTMYDSNGAVKSEKTRLHTTTGETDFRK